MMVQDISIEEQLNLSFDAHYHLVAIHPLYDGNGRTFRLLMNFIQAKYRLPLAIVNSENKAAYIEAIVKTKETEDPEHFRKLMRSEYISLLLSEIDKYQEMTKPSKGRGFSFLI